MTLRARLSKLESLFGVSSERMTLDELNIKLLLLSKLIVDSPETSAAAREHFREIIEEIEADIRAMAWKQRDAKWLQYYRQEWEKYGRKQDSSSDGYVPPVTGPSFDGGDWHMPRVMERRAALWAMPEVRTLVASAS